MSIKMIHAEILFSFQGFFSFFFQFFNVERCEKWLKDLNKQLENADLS